MNQLERIAIEYSTASFLAENGKEIRKIWQYCRNEIRKEVEKEYYNIRREKNDNRQRESYI